MGTEAWVAGPAPCVAFNKPLSWSDNRSPSLILARRPLRPFGEGGRLADAGGERSATAPPHGSPARRDFISRRATRQEARPEARARAKLARPGALMDGLPPPVYVYGAECVARCDSLCKVPRRVRGGGGGRLVGSVGGRCPRGEELSRRPSLSAGQHGARAGGSLLAAAAHEVGGRRRCRPGLGVWPRSPPA